MMALVQLVGACLLFAIVMFGLGWPIAAKLPFDAIGRLVATLVVSVALTWLVAWTIFVTNASWNLFWAVPFAATVGIVTSGRAALELWRDSSVRAVLVGFALVAAWCLGWLALIQSYSGGGWSGDWFEHWERALFFINRPPLDTLIITAYSLPARPPLGNTLVAGFLTLTGIHFYTYQIISTLLSCLAFIPAAALALRWRPERMAVGVLALLFLTQPLLLQNATFPWTKLPTAALVLASLYFFLKTAEPASSGAAAMLFSTALASAILTHYSALPYALVLAVLWFVRRPFTSRRDNTIPAAAVGLLLLATWFGWSIASYGTAGTLLSNSTVTTVEPTLSAQAARVLLNFRDTVVPHFLRAPDPALIQQTSPWGFARDWFFQAYQLNVLFAFGCVGWLVIARILFLRWRTADARSRGFWTAFVAGTGFLGIAVHSGRDEWGLAHICLQPLVVLGVACLAGHWHLLNATWRRLVVAGAAVDFLCGIVLHFGVQNFAFDRWLTPTRPPADIITSYNGVTQGNLVILAEYRFVLLHEALNAPLLLVLALLAAILILALRRLRTN